MLQVRALLEALKEPFSDFFKQRTTVGIRLRGQEVKTSPFHGGNTGSIPVGVTSLQFAVIFGSLAQLVRATGS